MAWLRLTGLDVDVNTVEGQMLCIQLTGRTENTITTYLSMVLTRSMSTTDAVALAVPK